MINFFRNYSIKNIKNKLLVLYILNITDMIFTYFLLGTGLFTEANFLVAKAIQSPSSGFWIKIVFPAILLILIYFRMRKAEKEQLKRGNYFINGILIFYALINLSHMMYFLLLIVITQQ